MFSARQLYPQQTRLALRHKIKLSGCKYLHDVDRAGGVAIEGT